MTEREALIRDLDRIFIAPTFLMPIQNTIELVAVIYE